MPGRLTTHVLDTMRGRPGGGVRIELNYLGIDGAYRRLSESVTNADGRTDAPLLAGATMKTGRYELLFHIGAYFLRHGGPLAEPPFLDIVPVRFGIADAAAHYHVPLLASPWSYTSYRGS